VLAKEGASEENEETKKADQVMSNPLVSKQIRRRA
jgi:hypothetical protein